MHKNIKKRALAGGIALALAGGAYNIAVAAVDELVIVSWGGSYSKSQQKAYHEPYMKKTGINIVNDDSAPEAVAKLRGMREAGNVSWDVVDTVISDSIRLCDEGLALELDFDKQLATGADGSKPTEDFLREYLINDCFIPQIVYSTTFGYRTDVAEWGGKIPTSIKDVFDLENFPGKRSLEKRPINNLEWALLADGVPANQIYDVLATPEGVDRAFAKLDTIKDQIVWWSAGAETPQRLADKEVVIGSTYNGRLFTLIEVDKQPVSMLWDWQVFDVDGWIVPAGLSPEREKAALEFLYFSTDSQRLADQAKYISYAPARKSSVPLLGKHAELGIDMAPHMPTAPENSKTTLLYNYEWWADNRDELDQRFQAWLTQ